jgi:hypothetical protein
MLSFGSRHQWHNTDYCLHSIQKRVECTSFLQAQVLDPKAITDYKRETFEFHTRDVHPADQMDLHRKIGEIIFSTLANASTVATKL